MMMTQGFPDNIEELVRELPTPVDWNKYIDPWESTDRFADPKVIAVDFDETISDNPGTWLTVMGVLERAGYHVVVVTWRTPHCAPQELEFLRHKGYKIYYTSHTAKKPFMEHLGIDVAIWIDDNPFAILNDLSQSKGVFWEN